MTPLRHLRVSRRAKPEIQHWYQVIIQMSVEVDPPYCPADNRRMTIRGRVSEDDGMVRIENDRVSKLYY